MIVTRCAYGLLDSCIFLYRWILASVFLGTVIVISNASDEVLGLVMYATLVGPRGYGDHTWKVGGQRDVIQRKVPHWTIAPHRTQCFMLPFSTSLVVLGTESNFKYWVLGETVQGHYSECLKFRFISIWSTLHSFIPRFVTVQPDLKIRTSLRCGQCLPGHEHLKPAMNHMPFFQARVDTMRFEKLMLPRGEPVAIGPTLWMPDSLDRNFTLSTSISQSHYGLTLINSLKDVVNELSALIEVVHADTLFENVLASYIFWMIMVWNSLKDQISPACQYAQYGANSFLLTSEHSFDCMLAALCLAFPGGLQAILVLLISRPRNGLSLLSVVLAFGNLAFFVSTVALRVAHFMRGSWFYCLSTQRSRYLIRELLSFVIVGIPLYALATLGYYTEEEVVANIVKYTVAILLGVSFHLYFIFYLPDLDVAMKGITPVTVMNIVSHQLKLVINLFRMKTLKWVVEKLIKYLTEFLICLVVLLSVAINAYVLFEVQGYSIA